MLQPRIMKAFKGATAAVNYVELMFTRISAGAIMLMMFATTADVIGRYAFNSPIAGVYEGSELIMPLITFLAIAYVQSIGGHLKVDIISTRFKGKAWVSAEIFSLSLCLIIFAIMTWSSASGAWQAFISKDYTLGLFAIPKWPSLVMLPIGAGLLCIQLIIDIVKTATGNRVRRSQEEV